VNIIFAGTPEFAAIVLDSLIHHSHYSIKAVYTQPDRPAGRGRQVTPSPVKQLALQYDLPICQPQSLKEETTQKILAAFKADLMIVVAYGLILPQKVLQIPRLGCLNIHASLLPRWRGAAPIQRAILAGDQETGITIMQMNEGLDTGPMLGQITCPIYSTDNSQTLHDKLARLGTDFLLQTIEQLSIIKCLPQDSSHATYAAKISKEEARLNWSLPAIELDRIIRAFNPRPVAFTFLEDKIIRIWEASLIKDSSQAAPGEIIQTNTKGIDVTTGSGTLRITKMQLPGGRILSVADILNARSDVFLQGKCFN